MSELTIIRRVRALARRNGVVPTMVPPSDGRVCGLASIDLVRTSEQLHCRVHDLLLPHTVTVETDRTGSDAPNWRWLEDVIERVLDLDGVSPGFGQQLIEDIEEQVQAEVRDLYRRGEITFARARELLGDLDSDEAREVLT